MTRKEWVALCAAYYAKHGHVADDVADEMAEAFADMHQASLGVDATSWPNPQDAARDDIAGWTDD